MTIPSLENNLFIYLFIYIFYLFSLYFSAAKSSREKEEQFYQRLRDAEEQEKLNV